MLQLENTTTILRSNKKLFFYSHAKDVGTSKLYFHAGVSRTRGAILLSAKKRTHTNLNFSEYRFQIHKYKNCVAEATRLKAGVLTLNETNKLVNTTVNTPFAASDLFNIISSCSDRDWFRMVPRLSS